MGESINILLSKEYSSFAKKVVLLSQVRENLSNDLKETQKEFAKRISEIEKEILSSQIKFESWKKEFLLSVGDG